MKPRQIIPALGAAIALLVSALFVFGCKSDSTNPVPRTGTITQTELDAATTAIASGVVGDSFTVFESFASPPDTQTSRHRLRDIFSTIPKTTAVSEGTVIVREAFNDAA